MTIDLRELAKSLMFAEKAKEEAVALKRDNEELYKVNGMYIEQYQQDQAKINELEEAYRELNISLNLKIKQLYDENKELRELRQSAALNHDAVVDCIHNTYQQKIDTVKHERDHYKSRYETIREILLPLWDDKQ